MERSDSKNTSISPSLRCASSVADTRSTRGRARTPNVRMVDQEREVVLRYQYCVRNGVLFQEQVKIEIN